MKRSSNKRRLITLVPRLSAQVLLITLMIVVSFGIAKSESMNVAYGFVKSSVMRIDQRLPPLQQAALANKSQYQTSFTELTSDKNPLIDDLPIGTIIAYHVPPGGFQFSVRWQVALGQTISDPDSPFNGVAVPDLNGNTGQRVPTYLAGTLDSTKFGNPFGSDTLPIDGKHNHGGATQGVGGRSRADGGNDLKIPESGHTHNIGMANDHDHGGDNKPRTHGIVYLIKIK